MTLDRARREPDAGAAPTGEANGALAHTDGRAHPDDAGAVVPHPRGTGAPTPSSPPAGTAPGDLADPVTTPVVPVQRVGSPERADRPSLGWTELAVAAVSYVVLQLVLGAAAVVVSGGVLPSAPWLAALSAVSALGAVGIALVLRVRSRLAVGLRRVRPRTVLLAIGLGVLVWALSRVLIAVYVTLTGDASDPQQDLTTFTGPVSTVLTIVIAGLAVPLGEELLFRGVGYGSLRRYGVVVPTLVSAAVFGLAHGLNVVLAAAVLLGVVNARLYERTRSIWPSVAAHATFNLLSFGLLVAFG